MKECGSIGEVHDYLRPLVIHTVSYTSQSIPEDEVTRHVERGELRLCARVDTTLSLTCLDQLRYQAICMASQHWLQQSFVGESRTHCFTDWSDSIVTLHEYIVFIKQHF